MTCGSEKCNIGVEFACCGVILGSFSGVVARRGVVLGRLGVVALSGVSLRVVRSSCGVGVLWSFGIVAVLRSGLLCHHAASVHHPSTQYAIGSKQKTLNHQKDACFGNCQTYTE